MTKIKLSLDSLRVESFDTSAAERGQGTVLGHAKTIDFCATAAEINTGCGPDCVTWYLAGCPSAADECPSSPHSITLPCNGCVETDHFCVIDGTALGTGV